MEQINLFNVMYETFKIDKPIRLIELFAGYGSQNLALKYLGANYEHHRICEWATKSIQAYNDLHVQDYTDYSKPIPFENVAYYLHKKGISLNYNEPMSLEQIKRKGEQWCRTTYNNIIATRNLVNIQQVHGRDLDIYDTESFVYLLTYSFPCQDLSLAGKCKGMAKGSGTRSGMLWEVERILNECNEIGRLPQCLLMENVPMVHSKENMPHFQEWIKALENLGYQSYWKDLNAKDYGIPQNRDRTFMVSILGDWYYEFPKKIQLKLRLKDMLEDNVDEKYYLSEKMIEFFKENSKRNEEKGNGFRFNTINENTAHIAKTITTRAGGRMDDNFIEIVGKIEEWHQRGEVYNPNGIAPTICATDYKTPKLIQTHNGTTDNFVIEKPKIVVGEDKVIIPEAPSKGYAEAYEGDGIYINRPHQKRGVVQKGMIPTLKTSCDDVAIVTTSFHPSYTDKEELRIRKLTPRECGRLMGVKDEDIDKMAKNQSDGSLYHLFGDSIVVNVLMAIFQKLLN